MLSSLPYAHPARLGAIYARATGSSRSERRRGLDGEKRELLRDGVLALICAVSGSTSGVNFRAGSRVEYVHDGRVSTHYFDVLELQPVIGRNFSDAEDVRTGPKAAILSYSLWRTVFAEERSVVGQAILLRGEPYTRTSRTTVAERISCS